MNRRRFLASIVPAPLLSIAPKSGFASPTLDIVGAIIGAICQQNKAMGFAVSPVIGGYLMSKTQRDDHDPTVAL